MGLTLTRPLSLHLHSEVWLGKDGDVPVVIRRYLPTRAGGPRPGIPDPDVLAALDGPGLPRLLGTGTDDEGATLHVFEHLAGRPLREVLAGGPLNADAVLGLLRDIGGVLERLHGGTAVSPRIHGDVSPGNVLVLDGGGFALLDALALRPGTWPAGDGIVYGTLPYLATAVLAGSPPDAASDRESLAWVALAAARGGAAVGRCREPQGGPGSAVRSPGSRPQRSRRPLRGAAGRTRHGDRGPLPTVTSTPDSRPRTPDVLRPPSGVRRPAS
jgi:serine/threonine protein kinase